MNIVWQHVSYWILFVFAMLTYQTVQSSQFDFILDHRLILNKYHISNLQK
jgi:hypothetical protein